MYGVLDPVLYADLCDVEAPPARTDGATKTGYLDG